MTDAAEPARVPDGEPRDGLGARIAANTIVQAVGTVLSALLGLGTFLALARGLGAGSFGDYTAAVAFLSFPVVIADIGLTSGVLREISAQPERTERAMGAFLPLSVGISAAAVAGLTGVGLALPFEAQTKTAIAIGAFGAFLSLVTLSVAPVLQARLKMHWAVAAALAGRLVGLVLVIGALAAGLGFKSVVAATVVGTAVTCALQVAAVLRLVRIRPHVDVGYWRRLASTSVWLGLSSALGQVNFRVGTVLLALFRSSAEVGYYGAAYKFVELVHTTAGSVGISVFPSLARFAATADARLERLASRTLDVLVAAAAPAMILMVAFPTELLRWTAGGEYEPGAVALQLLAIFVPFGLVNHLLWRLLAAYREDRALVAITAAALAATVVLNALLTPRYGIEAAAVVTAAVEVAVVVAAGAVLVLRHRALPSGRYLTVVGAATAPAVLVAVLMPGPALVVATISLGAYLAILVALPGTAREVLSHVAAAARPRTGAPGS